MVDPKVKQILDAVLTHAEKVIDGIDCFYVALYNQVTVALDFPLAVKKSGEGLKRLETGNGRWASRPHQPTKFLPDYIFADVKPKSVLIKTDFEGWLAANELNYQVDKHPLSWLGVPLVARGRVVGVIVVENCARERAYDERSRNILSAMANRAAGALANARLVESLRAVNAVGQRLTSGIRLSVDEILELIYEQASQLMDTRNMYIALYDEGTDVVSFGLARQDGETVDVEKDEDWQPRKAGKGLTERIIRSRAPFCPQDVKAAYEEAGVLYVEPIPQSWLGVPMMIGDRVLGVIAVQNDDVENLYGPDDQAVLQTMAGQAAVALANARLVESLRAVNAVGQRLTSGIRLSVDEILELIYEQASQLMDTRNMYIALYDEGTDVVSFGLARQNGETVDVEKDEDWQARKAGKGLTERVIRSRAPFCPQDVKAAYEEAGVVYVEPIPQSWLGVPMMIGDRVLGVIAVQNDDVKNLYGPDDQAVLQTMANQAAVAIENTRLYGEMEKQVEERTRAWQEAQERAVAAEKLAVMSQVAAEFAHRMNNLAGTIPVRVNLAKENLDVDSRRNAKVIRQLDGIASDTQLLLQAAQEIKQSVEARAPEDVALNELLDIAIGRVWSSLPDVEGRVTVKRVIAGDLPKIHVERNRLLDTLVSVIRNGVEAIPGEGELTISVQKGLIRDESYVQIVISDTGVGIPASDLSKIFDLFYTKKEKGLGFGLWRDRTFIKRLGGDVVVESEEGKGSTFTIKIPLKQV
jgi:GAF domain-containing protein